jgi:hypothetical protein
MSKEDRFENRQWNDAVREAKRGYKQLSDFDWKVEEAEPKRAASHLRKALDDFNSALTHIAKAEVGLDQKGAVDDVNRGVEELNSAVTDLDNGEVSSAQRHYDEAVSNFGKADVILS